jgi:D-beta-D-heptose 7-phosphate kinase / D-beta-D-heptose 1-phosphate adenosyltransferase
MLSNYQVIIERFRQPAVLVIGDIILDTYLKGTSSRLSPEAPVPVICIESRTDVTGGAANIAVNLCSLGARVSCLSVVGNDEDGSKALRMLQQLGVDCSAVVRDESRKTMVKTRVMAQSQILSRFDYGSETPIGKQAENQLIRFLLQEYKRFDIVLLGDYYRGILTDRLIEMIADLQRQNPKFLAVDSKDLVAFRMIRPTLVKPNYTEACRILNIPTQSTGRREQIFDKGRALYDRTEAEIIALTLDADGATIFEKGEYAYGSYAYPVPTPKVVGAGDTFISALSLALATGADIPVATELATAASSIAVRKDSTAACTQVELSTFFSRQEKLIGHPMELKKLCELYKAQGRKIVFTNGCFDILHSGHISLLNRSKELGEVLIVGVNSDDSIRRLKGNDRPINSLSDRIEVLCGLSSIDHVIPFGGDGLDTPLELIRAAQPDIYAKGGEYSRDTLPETSVIDETGGKIVFIPLVPEHSTSLIINKIHRVKTEPVKLHA